MLGPIFFGPFFPMLQCSIAPICLVMTGHMTCKRACGWMQTLRFAARSGLRSRHGRVMTHARRSAPAHPHPPTRARTDAIHHSIHPLIPVFSQPFFHPQGQHPHPGKKRYTPPPLKFPALKFKISVLCFRSGGTGVDRLEAPLCLLERCHPPEKNMTGAKSDALNDGDPDLWDQTVMDGVNGDTGMTPDAVFVREYVRTGDAMLATSRAGLNDSRYTLSVLAEHHLRRPEIQAAIEIAKQLNRDARPLGMEYTRELILEDLERLHQDARVDGAYAPAISAKKVQAQLLGYLDQTVNVRHSMEPREMTTDELRRRIAELSGDRVALEDNRPSVIEAEYTEVGNGSD